MKRTEEFYEGDREAVLSVNGRGETLQDVMARRLHRRAMMKAGTGAGLVLTMGPTLVHAQATPEASPVASPVATVSAGPTFEPIALTEGDELAVAANHVAVPFLR
ncbi:MAG TPA: hypothetical protein VEW66_07145, partial [Thermomicrobiales bacterium]|nr:hypothetical protein [Thermomicrobiales bacterium]